jgi:type IV pilus assembly protein PilA
MQTFPREMRPIIQFLAVLTAFFLTASVPRAQVRIQNAPAESQTRPPISDDLSKNSELLKAYGNLINQFQHNIQYPGPRSESRLLPLLPVSTMIYAAFPNYGQTSDQALKILRQELQDNSAFRDWWHKGDMATTGPKLEDALEKFSELNAFLGEEIVVSGATDGKVPNFVIVAEVRKPGLKKYLQQMFQDLASKTKPQFSVLDPQELATASDKGASQDGVILVRPDFVVAAKNLAALRSFSARLDHPGREFAATPFGKRVEQEYQGGVTALGAADLQGFLNQAPLARKQNVSFQQSGFADVKYAVWETRRVDGKSVSQFELSFNAPRKGAAAWLAKSGPLSSLDFVSPDAILSATLLLSNPSQIFDDVKGLASLTNPNAFAPLSMFEQVLHLSVKDDLLGLLHGDITLELDSAAPPKPEWRAILGVKDTDHLQRTLNTLLTAANMVASRDEEGGVAYYSLRIPTAKTVMSLTYAFVDGHMIVGSSQDAVAKSIELHHSGGSLAKSKKLLASLPPGQSLNASGLIYEDPIAMATMQMRNFAPQVADSMAAARKDSAPTAAWIYGEDSAIREMSSNSTFNPGTALILAAIAIPNLLRSKMAANEASAVAAVRTVNTAQVTYKTNFPQRGYAASLSTLGPDASGTLVKSQDHANLLSGSLASESCNPDGWCLKDGFRFKLTSACTLRRCQEYVLLAVPVSTGTGTRNFCSTSDGVIRSKPGAPWEPPLTASDCKGWLPIQ